MIKVKVWGGTGNQLFQYAFARCLEIQTGKDVKLELSWFKKNAITKADTVRDFSLDRFNTRYYIDDGTERCKQIITEDRISGFDLENDDVYYVGFWQSIDYFKGIEELIRTECTPKIGLIGNKTKTLAKEIESLNSVCVHVRRGDYCNPQSGFQPCSIEYYIDAVNYIKGMNEDIEVFFFSDDINSVKKDFGNVFKGNNRYVSSGSDVDDLFLMGKCRYHVIANSSFSWWGSFLSDRSECTVAPKKWDLNKERKEIYLPEWHII